MKEGEGGGGGGFKGGNEVFKSGFRRGIPTGGEIIEKIKKRGRYRDIT